MAEGRPIGAWRWAAAFALALLLSLVVTPDRAEAGINSCQLTTGGIIFSPYNPQSGAAVDGTGTITITCQGNSSSNPASVHITGGFGSCTAREMRNGANVLGYLLYRDAGRTARFCTGTDRVDLNFALNGDGSDTKVVTLYGRVTALQNPVFGNYADTITITVRNSTAGTVIVTNSSVPITGSVAAICTVSAGTLGFGAYSGTAVNATASIGVNCTNGAGYQVAMSGGSYHSGTTRQMAGPSSGRLAYQLFRDSARSLPWGDGSALLGQRQGGTGSGAAQSVTVYGRIPAGQTPAAGSYTDSVVVTVEY